MQGDVKPLVLHFTQQIQGGTQHLLTMTNTLSFRGASAGFTVHHGRAQLRALGTRNRQCKVNIFYKNAAQKPVVLWCRGQFYLTLPSQILCLSLLIPPELPDLLSHLSLTVLRPPHPLSLIKFEAPYMHYFDHELGSSTSAQFSLGLCSVYTICFSSAFRLAWML